MAEILEFRRPSAKFTKVTASFRPARERLSRTFLIRSDADLIELGCALRILFGASPAHMFLFFAKGRLFVPRSVLGPEGTQPMAEHTLKDLGSAFVFSYDTVGDNWEFDCTAEEEPEERTEKRRVLPLEAVGQGIWEDDLAVLKRFLSGELAPEERAEEDAARSIFLPWNFPVKKWGDFDAPVDASAIRDEADMRLADEAAMLRTAEESERILSEDELKEAFGGDVFEEEDDFCDEDADDLFRRLIPEDPDPLAGVMDMLASAVEIHIGRGDIVDKTFERLSEDIGEEEALNVLAEVFFKELMGLVTLDTPFGTEHLKEELKKL